MTPVNDRSLGWALSCALLVSLVATSVSASVASAHTHREVGEYEFVVGWRAEPPFVGVLNGLDLGVFVHDTGEPVEGEAGNLSATLSLGTATMTSSVRPQFGRPGWYTFDVVPTRAGTYSVRIEGTVQGTPVDLTVELETVRPQADVAFPETDPTPSELQESLASLQAENAALQGLLWTVLAVAVVGVLVGAAGAVLGFKTWRGFRRQA